MSPTEENVSKLDDKHVKLIVKLVADVLIKKLEGSDAISLATLTLLEQIISDLQNTSVIEICGVLRSCGRHLQRALPLEASCGNMTRRVLRALRDEHRAHANQSAEGGRSLRRVLVGVGGGGRRATLGPSGAALRDPLREHLAELRAELEGGAEAIAAQARSHVHADELILTSGASRLAELFLRAAATRRYRLLLAEGPDLAECHSMARRLSAGGVSVTVVGHAAVCAVMSRVNKVVVSCDAVLAGGALRAPAGLRSVTTAAKHYSVPVIVLAPLYALSPSHAGDTALTAPHTALPYECLESSVSHVYAPVHDHIPPDHVTLIVTNLGGSSPSYIYRLLSELYDPVDYDI